MDPALYAPPPLSRYDAAADVSRLLLSGEGGVRPLRREVVESRDPGGERANIIQCGRPLTYAPRVEAAGARVLSLVHAQFW